MDMQGAKVIAADTATVWAALNDPEVLKEAIPGCTELEKHSDTELSATVVQKVGPVKATFKGAVELQDVVPGQSYKIVGEGKGGVAGFAKGSAEVKLAEVEGGTELSYVVQAKIGGKLAQLGSRIIDGFAKRMADDFFTRFQQQVEGPKDDADQSVDAGEDDAAVETAKKPGFFKRLFGGKSEKADAGPADTGGDASD